MGCEAEKFCVEDSRGKIHQGRGDFHAQPHALSPPDVESLEDRAGSARMSTGT